MRIPKITAQRLSALMNAGAAITRATRASRGKKFIANLEKMTDEELDQFVEGLQQIAELYRQVKHIEIETSAEQ